MDEDNAALELLAWGVQYSFLVTDHVAWSQKLIDAEIDNSRKIITFHLPDVDIPQVMAQLQSDLDMMTSELVDHYPERHFANIFNAWQQNAEWHSGTSHRI